MHILEFKNYFITGMFKNRGKFVSMGPSRDEITYIIDSSEFRP